MDKKKWYQSKTIWANVLGVVADVALNLSGTLATGGALTIGSVVNMGLRLWTKHQITK
jgi:hypothetical protein